MSGSLERMIITAYANAGFTTQVGQPFTVWMNPASYTHNYSVLYSDRQGQGSNGPSPEFNRIGPETIGFDLTFDATGIVPPTIPGTPIPSDGVAGALAQFKTLVATVNSTSHSPNYVTLAWAQLQFQCVLTKLNITYSLFKPDGTPLRAKASVSFLAFNTEQQLAKKANFSSPDLTHQVKLVAGDTLPNLCHRIYGSSTYYLRVAAFNRLSGFRQLPAGLTLTFPPLDTAS